MMKYIRRNGTPYICYGDTNLRHKIYLYLDTLKTSKELEDILLLFAVN